MYAIQDLVTRKYLCITDNSMSWDIDLYTAHIYHKRNEVLDAIKNMDPEFKKGTYMVEVKLRTTRRIAMHYFKAHASIKR
jgi:hypothetical protein